MTSQEQENKALVRRFTEDVYNRRNLDAAVEFLAPDFVDHGVSAGKEGYIEAYKQQVANTQASSSDVHFSIEEMIAEGDKVVSRVIGSGSVDQRELEGGSPHRGAHNDREHQHQPRGRRQDRR